MIRHAAVLLALALTTCSPSQPGTSDASQLRGLDAKLEQAINRKDAAAIAAFYAEDAIWMPTAEPIIRGKRAIAEEWNHVLAIPEFENDSQLDGVEVAQAGDLAYTYGSYRSRMLGEDGKLTTEPGKWLTIWKKQTDGSWRIVVDSYNTDIPPPDHK